MIIIAIIIITAISITINYIIIINPGGDFTILITFLSFATNSVRTWIEVSHFEKNIKCWKQEKQASVWT
jgi:hypothetical protein